MTDKPALQLRLDDVVICDKGVGKIVGWVRAGWIIKAASGTAWIRKGDELVLAARWTGKS